MYGHQGKVLRVNLSDGRIEEESYSPDYAKDAKRLAEFKGLRSVTTLTKPIRLAKLRAVLGGQEG